MHDHINISSDCLLNALHEFHPKEEERRSQKLLALDKLSLLLKVWARMVVYQLGYDDKIVARKHLKLVPFGSFKYEDSSMETDLDVLCITSRYITRKHFFHDLRRLFEGLKEVQDFTVVMTAYIPIMKMKFNGVAMDICYSQIDTGTVGVSTVRDIERMKCNVLDDKSLASLNGCIMTSKIMRLVPNFTTFTTTLNAIKLWAKKKNVYSALLGFLGGSSLSILVAKICQLSPYATPSTLVTNFFEHYSTWDWNLPVYLEYPSDNKTESLKSDNTPWAPQRDCTRDVMKIMTPLIPPTNTSHSVSRSSLHVIVDEFRQAAQLLRSECNDETIWTKLFQPPTDFFQLHSQFVHVSTSVDEECEKEWEGWVQSRLSGLVKNLEAQTGVEYAHLNISQFVERWYPYLFLAYALFLLPCCSDDQQKMHLFIGIALDPTYSPSNTTQLVEASISQFLRLVCAYREFDSSAMSVAVDVITRDEIPPFVFA